MNGGWGSISMATRTRKAPDFRGLSVERMMGLEPTTFCMASRRSSQLSYIRVHRSIARYGQLKTTAPRLGRPAGLGSIERLVDKAVRKDVVFPPHRAIGHETDLPFERLYLEGQLQ